VQRHGERKIDPEAERWRAVVSAAVTRLRAVAPSGVLAVGGDRNLSRHPLYNTWRGILSRRENSWDESYANAAHA